jgi:serine/threonine protein phosphatase PrpC
MNIFTLLMPVAEPAADEPQAALAKLEFLVAPVITFLLAANLTWDMDAIHFAFFAIVAFVSWNQYCREKQRTQGERKVVDLKKLALDKILFHWSKTKTPITETFLRDEIINHHISTWSHQDQGRFVQVEFPIVKLLLVSTACQAQVITSIGVDHTFQWEWKYANYDANGQKVDCPRIEASGGNTANQDDHANEASGDSGAVPEAAETAPAPKSRPVPQRLQRQLRSSNPAKSALRSPGLHTPSHQQNEGRHSAVQSPHAFSYLDMDSPLQQRILSAVQKQAEAMESGSSKLEDGAFRLCMTQKWDDSMRQKLKTMIETNPRLLTSRASKTLGHNVASLTMFMAAAYANQVDALQVIWDYVELNPNPTNGISFDNLLRDVNLQGRTACHIAGELGCKEATEFIISKLPADPAKMPRDAMNRTPVGVTTLAPRNKDSGHLSIIERYATETDKSYVGFPLAPQERVVLSGEDNHAQAGISEMPGKRVLMEDYIHCLPLPSGLLLSVCDGHEDRGLVSEFVAKSVVSAMKKKVEGSCTASWQMTCLAACLDVDNNLKIQKLTGGSAGIFAAITEKEIVVANVGDCRCILVQFKSEKDAEDFLSDAQKFSGSDKDDPVACQDIITTIPLSTDHKPSLPEEEKRIVESGAKVVEFVVPLENDEKLVLHKILFEGKKLSMSRAFGDFEFKANRTIDRELQAVIANPDVTVRERCSVDAFVILACDGIWDVMSNEEVAAFVTMGIHHHLTNVERGVAILPTVADELVRHCFTKKGSEDNLSVVIAALSTVDDWIADLSETTADRIANVLGSTAKTICFDAQT